MPSAGREGRVHAHLAVLAPALDTGGDSAEIPRAPVLAKGAAAACEVLRALQHVDKVEDDCLVEALARVFEALGGADHDWEVGVAVHVCHDSHRHVRGILWPRRA